MTIVSGYIKTITGKPSNTLSVSVRADRTRPSASGVTTAEPQIVSWDPESGELSFIAEPGDAVISLSLGNRLESIPISVPEKATATLEEVVSEKVTIPPPVVNLARQDLEELRVNALAQMTEVNGIPRIEALELMGGLTPGEPVDGQQANLISQPDTLSRAAVRAASVEVVHESAPVITVGPAGQFETQSSWNVSTGGDDYRAIQDAIDACPVGGTVHFDFRGRDTFSSETLLITKPIRITSGTTTEVSGGRLWFPMHKTGFVVQAPQSGGSRPSNVVMENLYIRGPIPTDHAPSESDGVGIHVKDGRVHFSDIIVQFMSGHGLYLQAGRQHDHYGDNRPQSGGNITKSQFDNIRVANVWGDGIKLHGADTQACLFVKPDVAGCKGWGIHMDTANINQVIMPHFDQRGGLGIIRDIANSNDYGFIYAETGLRQGETSNNGGVILLDKDSERESINASFEVAYYAGSIKIVDNTTSRSANFFDRRARTQRRSLGVTSTNDQHSFQFDSGHTGTSSFTLRYVPGDGSSYPQTQSILDHNLATDLTTLRRRVKMQDQLRLAVVNPPVVARPNPVNAGAGAMMFDSSIGKIIVSNGTEWTDGLGNPLGETPLPPAPRDSINTAPDWVGQTAVVNGNAYIAVGTESATDWKQITSTPSDPAPE